MRVRVLNCNEVYIILISFILTSTKVECGGCCLANKYCIAFKWTSGSNTCDLAYTTHVYVLYGEDATSTEYENYVEVYRDESLIEKICFIQG